MALKELLVLLNIFLFLADCLLVFRQSKNGQTRIVDGVVVAAAAAAATIGLFTLLFVERMGI